MLVTPQISSSDSDKNKFGTFRDRRSAEAQTECSLVYDARIVLERNQGFKHSFPQRSGASDSTSILGNLGEVESRADLGGMS